ncbi:MAG: LemA family protein [Bacteroidetes bacterium]|nr:LemA family protein [Bacteroidota bacterium]MBU1678081.1 LemA family protein [Bacteroidota bacterium]MBU2507117.1 LemA family protein [Bacteroidota bacterium]
MNKKVLFGCGGVLAVALIVGVMLVMWGVGIYNNLVTMDEQVTSSWSQVENQYQRRTDLIPNLVNTVKGVAAFEKETFTAVTEARSRVNQINVSSDILNDPNAFRQFQSAQDGLSSALSRLLVTVEKYPELKANENFLQLQAQLEGTENRISVERKKFNESVQTYNTTRRRFPANFIAGIAGFGEKQYFQAVEGSDVAPKVEF